MGYFSILQYPGSWHILPLYILMNWVIKETGCLRLLQKTLKVCKAQVLGCFCIKSFDCQLQIYPSYLFQIWIFFLMEFQASGKGNIMFCWGKGEREILFPFQDIVVIGLSHVFNISIIMQHFWQPEALCMLPLFPLKLVIRFLD